MFLLQILPDSNECDYFGPFASWREAGTILRSLGFEGEPRSRGEKSCRGWTWAEDVRVIDLVVPAVREVEVEEIMCPECGQEELPAGSLVCDSCAFENAKEAGDQYGNCG